MLSLLKAVQRGTCFLNSRSAQTFKLIKHNFVSRQGGDDGDNQDSFQAGGFGGNRGGFSKPYGNNGGFGGNKGGNNSSSNSSYGRSNGFQKQNKFLDQSKTQDDAPSNNNMNYEGDNNHLGENLQDVDFSKIELAPFQKIFYQPSTSIHSEEAIKNYQTEKGIIIKSKHTEVPQPFLTWPETKFPKFIMSVVEESKFSDPMPIQAQSFPIVLSGHDLIGIAQTGSGKTLAFMLPALVHINAQDPVRQGEGPIVLVLAPTRELANQIQEQCYKFGSRCKISSVCVYGGAPKFHQEKELRRGCDVVIATPGRLIDFLEGKVIDLKRVTYLVLDEADRMLDMGFEPSIRKIVGQIRPDRQTLMFSATWPQQVRKLALDFCHSSPIHIQIGSMENNVNKDIEQIVEIVEKNQKYARLKELLLGMERTEKTIIFTQTKKDCDDLSEALFTDNIRNACIHGDKSQRERDKVMDQFKSGRINTLIATDVASRGLDVKDIKLVVNFDFPQQMDDYVHRVGRTGRAGATGKAISFIDSREDKRVAQELVDILRQSNQVVSEELLELAGNGRGGNGNGFRRGNGYGGYNKYSGNSNGGYSNNRSRSNSYGDRYRSNQDGENGNRQSSYNSGSRNGGYSSYNKEFRNREQHEDGSDSNRKMGSFNSKKD